MVSFTSRRPLAGILPLSKPLLLSKDHPLDSPVAAKRVHSPGSDKEKVVLRGRRKERVGTLVSETNPWADGFAITSSRPRERLASNCALV